MMRGHRAVVLGLTFLVAALPAAVGLAGEAYKQEPAPAPAETKPPADTPKDSLLKSTETPAAPEKPAAAKKPAGLVGTVVGVVPESRTVVVDVPRGKAVLRVGAAVTEKTKIMAQGAPASVEELKEGARVRIQFRRMATGDEATRVEILPGSKG